MEGRIMKHLKCWISALALTSMSFTAIAQTTYSNMVVFGDSLSDMHNTKGAPATNNNPDGSQPLWANDVRQSLFPNQTMYASTKIPKTTGQIYSTDYAYGGAITGGKGNEPTLIAQVSQYLKSVNNKASPTTLYLIWGGGNDLLADLNKIPHDTLQKGFPSVTPTINNLTSIVTTLKQHGATADHIFVLDMADLANTPRAHALTHNDPTKLGLITAFTALYNTALKNTLSEYIPNNNIVLISKLAETINTNPSKYGFTDLHDSCVAAKKMPSCTGFQFYNDIHPTIKSHALIAQTVLSSIK
jgi:outer membrane lipase/esterase